MIKSNRSVSSSKRALIALSLTVAATFAACGGSGGGGNNNGQLVQPGASLQGLARYQDVDGDGLVGVGDTLTLAFNRSVDASQATAEDFALSVEGDTFGTDATVADGPAENEVTVTLGADAVLRSRGRFSDDALTANSPSGVDVREANAILDADGLAADPSSSKDIAPVFVPEIVSLTDTDLVAVAVGDINWDEESDVVVATEDAILTHIGDGKFAMTSTGDLTGTDIRGIAIADLNRFTADEIVSIHDGFTQVWNNSGDKVKGPKLKAGQKLTTGDTRALALADLNRDGKVDIITVSTDAVRVFLHQKNLGNTYKAGDVFGLTLATSIAAFDVDRDGDIDLVIGRSGDNPGRLLRNDGSGTLSDGGSIGVNGIVDLAMGDVDGDGICDLVAARGSESTQQMINSGLGVFTSSEVATPAEKVRLADVDGDSCAELMTCDGEETALWMNDRQGGFEKSGFASTEAGTEAIEMADVDRDADADLLIAGAAGLDMFSGSLLGTQGSATFASTATLGLETSNSVAMGDVDGDGDIDQVVANSGINQVWLNDGAGNFSFSGNSVHSPGALDSRAVVLGDLDNDGDLDIVIGNTGTDGASNEIWANDGEGNFSIKQTFAPKSKTLSLALTQFDADQKLDIVVGNDGHNQVFENSTVNGVFAFVELLNRFQVSAFAKREQETIALITVDIDTDGDEDVIELNKGTELSPQQMQIYKRSGSFYFFSRRYIDRITHSMALGDWDGDGVADLAVGRSTTAGKQSVRIYRGSRVGFASIASFTLDTGSKIEPRGLALVDVNGDGHADLTIANRGAASELWISDGAGKFTRQQLLEKDDASGLAMADIDGDGDLDAIVPTTGSAANRVYTNR